MLTDGIIANITMEISENLIVLVSSLSLQGELAGMVARVESLRPKEVPVLWGRGRMGESTRQVEGLFESLLSEVFN